LQTEIAEAVADRPRMVNTDLFKNKVISDVSGAEQVIDIELATSICEGLITSGYVKKGVLTDKYYEDKKNGTIEIAEEAADCAADVINIIDSIYDSRALAPENARKNNVEAKLDKDKFDSKEFKALWAKINAKSVYVVDFDEDELIEKAIAALDRELRISKIFFKVELGSMKAIESKEQLQLGDSLTREEIGSYSTEVTANATVKYDLIGKVVAETGLTRHAVVRILKSIEKTVFDQFANNPEEFIIRAATIINEQKATAIIQHITYDKLDSVYDTTIFTEPTMKGQLGVNAMAAGKHLYDYIIYDSTNEKTFAEQVDTSTEVAVYVKLPGGFYISTPVGKYNPDWAIAFHEGKVKHIYFVAETKGSMSSMQLRMIEDAKIHCAREHFKAISTDSVVYDVVDSFAALMDRVMS
jgi:type III restriction enzyme